MRNEERECEKEREELEKKREELEKELQEKGVDGEAIEESRRFIRLSEEIKTQSEEIKTQSTEISNIDQRILQLSPVPKTPTPSTAATTCDSLGLSPSVLDDLDVGPNRDDPFTGAVLRAWRNPTSTRAMDVEGLLANGLGDHGIRGDTSDKGKVITLSHHLGPNSATGSMGGKVLITEDMYNIAELFEAQGFRSVLVRGSPGIGKSVLLLYVLLRNLAQGRIVLAQWMRPAQQDQHSGLAPLRCLFVPSRPGTAAKTVDCRCIGDDTAWRNLLDTFASAADIFQRKWEEHAKADGEAAGAPPGPPRYVLLGDGDAPKCCASSVFVVFSPYKNNWHNLCRDVNPRILTLPVPSEEEVLDMLTECYPDKLKQAQARLPVVGPWPRILLQDQEPTVEYIDMKVRMACTGVQNWGTTQPTERDVDWSFLRVSELVLLMYPRGDGAAKDYAHDKPLWKWNEAPGILDRVFRYLRSLDNSVAHSILCWEGHSLFSALVGGVFERSVYVSIWKGETFIVKEAVKAYVLRNKNAEKRLVGETHLAAVLPPMTFTNSLSDLKPFGAEGRANRLAVPLVENFPVIDGVIWLFGKPALLQVKKHSQVRIAKAAFESLVSDFRAVYELADDEVVSFVYVVKEGFAEDECRAPTFIGVKGLEEWEAFVAEVRVKFYLAYSATAAADDTKPPGPEPAQGARGSSSRRRKPATPPGNASKRPRVV